ncbi:hypothetical protein P7C70_g9311, partial [Phenoliferia sp. Uapishka_3]
MAKSKSSASSATRKKHAKKAALDDEEPNPQPGSASQPAQRGQKKGPKKSRFEPKVKSYTPPPPPPKGAPDPVDLYLNGGSGVDAELVVILRRLGKRDEATVFKAVEGFEKWVAEVGRGEKGVEDWEKDLKEDEVVEVLSVWAHHFPRLSLHPSRRLRLATLSLHLSLISPSSPIPGTRSALLAPLWLDQQQYVGAWCCSAFDGDRVVRSVARRSWDSVVSTSPPSTEENEEAEEEAINLQEQSAPIVAFLTDLIFTTDEPTSKDPEGTEPQTDHSILRIQSLQTLAYLIESPITLEESVIDLLQSEGLWDHLDKGLEGSAAARKAAYDVLGNLVKREEDVIGEKEGLLEGVSRVVLRNCWGERDG